MQKRNREINIFSVSFLDVFANTIGGLAFLLILAILMAGSLVFIPPKILTETLADGYYGQEYVTWLGAREGLGKFSWSFGEGERPDGLLLDLETGKLHGFVALGPSDGDKKRFDFAVNCEATSEEGRADTKIDTRRYALTVHRERPINTSPLRIITDATLPSAYRQQPYPLAFAAEGGQAPYRWSGNLAPGLSLGPDGQISGTPGDTGRFTFDVSVTTAQGERRAKTFTLVVSENYPPPPPIPPLKCATETIPAAVAERAYGVQLAAEGGSPPYQWSAVSGLPSWLKSGANGRAFTGKPALSDVGSNQVVWQVADSNGNVARSNEMKLEVLPAVEDQPPPLRIKTTLLPDARVGETYSLVVAAEGGFPPYSWQYDNAGSEEAVKLSNNDGAIAGTPNRVGEFPFSVSVIDRAEQKVTSRLSLKVRPGLLPVKILTDAVSVGRVGWKYSTVLSAVGGFSPYNWKLAGGELPPGLNLDESTGAVSGIPEKAGEWEARVTVADAEGRGAEAPLVLPLEVLTERGARHLAITMSSLPTLLAGQPSDITLACEGGTHPYNWRANGGLPAGLSIDRGSIVGWPTSPGEYSVALTVTDAGGEMTTATLPLTVKRVAPYWLAVLMAALIAASGIAIVVLAIGYGRRKPRPLRITTESIPNARASCEYSVQLACDGGVPPYRWRVADGELPPGMTVNEDGKVFGLPFKGIGVDATKDVPFTVEVVDRAGKTARQSL